jgi:hypothetical protein
VVQAPNGSSGLILYVPSGGASVSLASGTNGAIEGAPSPYEGIALWDVATGGITLGGNGGSGSIQLGGIYAPNSGVTYQGSYNVMTDFLVVNGATVGGGSCAGVGATCP